MTFLLHNAPVVEIIAEVHWKLERLKSSPNAAIDSLFPIFEPAFREQLQSHGFGSVERLVLEEIPLELIPSQPIFRYRSAPKGWPLYQVGPGLFTANVVPPYNGWAVNFQPHLRKGIETLIACYPLAQKALKITRLELRYVNAFTSRHGFTDFVPFVRDHLSIQPPIPNSFLADDPRTSFSIDVHFPIGGTDCLGGVRLSPGLTNGEPSAVLELISVEHNEFDHKAVTSWFDDANAKIRSMFGRLCSRELKEAMGSGGEF